MLNAMSGYRKHIAVSNPESRQNRLFERAKLATISTRATKPVNRKENHVLTFFEYLRQRAFESILFGAQEALDVLERQGTFEKRPTSFGASPQGSGQVALDQEAQKEHAEGPSDNHPAEAHASATDGNGERLPAPRLRRPSSRKGSRKR